MGDNRRIFSDNEKMVLFNEVDGRCPICGKPLTNTKNGQIIKMFDQTTPNMIQRISGVFERKPLILKEI